LYRSTGRTVERPWGLIARRACSRATGRAPVGDLAAPALLPCGRRGGGEKPGGAGQGSQERPRRRSASRLARWGPRRLAGGIPAGRVAPRPSRKLSATG